MLYTLKLAHAVPADRNRADVIQRRNEYAHWFVEEANLNHTIFIDKCGFNIWTSRSLGRSRQGDRAYRQVCGQKGRNIAICLAISPVFGLIYHKIQSGGMTGATSFWRTQTSIWMSMKHTILFSTVRRPIVELLLLRKIPKLRFCHHTLIFESSWASYQLFESAYQGWHQTSSVPESNEWQKCSTNCSNSPGGISQACFGHSCWEELG